jgi:hypothetical protein
MQKLQLHQIGETKPPKAIVMSFILSGELADLVYCAKHDVDRPRISIWRVSEKTLSHWKRPSHIKRCLALPRWHVLNKNEKLCGR